MNEEDYNKNERLSFYNERKLDTSVTWILFILFGWSYGSFGKISKQILYYITFGGFGLWTLYVLLTLNNEIKKHNRDIAISLGLDSSDLVMLGL